MTNSNLVLHSMPSSTDRSSKNILHSTNIELNSEYQQHQIKFVNTVLHIESKLDIKKDITKSHTTQIQQ